MEVLEIGSENSVTKDIPCRGHFLLTVRTLFHTVCLSHNIFVDVIGAALLGGKLRNNENLLISQLFYFMPAYVTNWNFAAQTMFLLMSVTYDFLQWMNLETSKFGQKLCYWKDVLFTGIVAPITMFVTGMFWSVYAIDRELVYPAVVDEVVPFWFNHCVHTNILVIVTVEALLQPRRHPLNEKLETILVWGITALYAVVYYSVYFSTGRWLYKVFGTMTWWQVVLFQTFIFLITYVFYLIQFPINRLIHGKGKISENFKEQSVNMIGSLYGNKEMKQINDDYNTENEVDNNSMNTVIKTKLDILDGKISGSDVERSNL